MAKAAIADPTIRVRPPVMALKTAVMPVTPNPVSNAMLMMASTKPEIRNDVAKNSAQITNATIPPKICPIFLNMTIASLSS